MNIESLNIDLKDGANYFHPSVAVMPDGRWIMTAQVIKGSDFYGEPVYAFSSDQGKSWSPAKVIESCRSRDLGGGWVENVADPRPFVFGDHKEVFVFGCTSIYSAKGNICHQDKPTDMEMPKVRAVCAILHPDGTWSRQELKLPIETDDWRTTCIQCALVADDEVILPFHFKVGTCMFGGRESLRAGVATARYRIVNGRLQFIAMGNILELNEGRGLLEPSLLKLPDNRGIAMTVRAENGKAYCQVSPDGLNWNLIQPWRWDNGEELATETTQQHWVCCGKKVYLVYTRKDESNKNIFRSRAPLYITEADPENATLIRAAEKIVFPITVHKESIGLFGNFHAVQLDEKRTLISDAALFRFPKENRRETRLMAAIVSN